MNTTTSCFKESAFAKKLALSLGLVAALAVPTTSRAASATWNGTVNATWSNAANWSASPVPGVADTATFSKAGNGNTNIDLTTGVGITVSNIVFDTSSAGPYTIGIGGAGGQMLTLPVNGAITVNSPVTSPQLFNASVSLGTNAAGNYFFANNSGQFLTIAGGISGGTAGAQNLFVGGSGTTAISGNIVNGSSTLTLTKVGAGALTLSGNDSNTGSIIVSNGTLNLTGSYAPPATGNLGAGAPNGTAPIGVINISAGSTINLSAPGAQNLFVGNYPSTLGVVNQNGGTISIGQNLKMGSDNASAGTNYGFYNMTGGAITMGSNNRFRIGQASGGPGSAFLFYLSGSGTISLNALTLGMNANANGGVTPGGNTVLYVSGGTITAGVPGSGGANGVSLGIGGQGGLSTNITTISGTGSVSLNGMTGLGASVSTSGSNSGRVAVLNLNGGGFLQTAQLYQDGNQSPTGYLNFNGGTLMAQTNNASFLAGLTKATMYNGGLTVNDNGAAITIGQALLAPTGNGVASIAVSGASGYVGAPYVSISGGNPTTPATAVALLAGSGNVTNIVITSPGTGYTSAPTVTLLDGGGTPGTLTPTLGASGSGGLTKTNTGTLTMSGANTYTGLTSVAQGALMLSGGTLGGPVTVASGNAFGGNGAVNGSVTLAPGATTLQLSNGVAAPLTVGNGLTLGNGNILTFELGSVASSDKIVLTGGTANVSGTVTIKLSALGGFSVGNYSLISGGSLAGTNGFVLGATPDPTLIYALTNNSGNLLVQITTTNASPTAFWWGDVDGNWNTTSPANNWAPNSAGTNNTTFLPNLVTAVTFATTNAANLATTLGASFEISTLAFTTPGSVTIGGANTLTIDSGLTVNPGAGAVTISAGDVALGFNQTWINNDSNPFTVSSPIIDNGNGISLAFAGTGRTTLSGVSTYGGGTVVDGGTLALGIANALNAAGAVTVNGGILDIGANSEAVGPVALISGVITGTVGVLSGSSFTVQSGAISAILGGGGGLTMTGTAVTVTLSATNTYTGSTFVSAGTLVLAPGGVISNGAASSIGHSGSDNGSLTLQGNASFGAGIFSIGDADGSQGTLNLSGNATVYANEVIVGSASDAGSGAQGVVNQSGGTLTVTGVGAVDGSFILGGTVNLTGCNGLGTYNLSGGSVLVAGGNGWIGGWGQGALNVTGGGITFSNFLSVGREISTTVVQPDSHGTLTVSGSGVVTQANPFAHTVIGELSTGTLVVASSGLMVVQGNDGLILGNGPLGQGTVNLNGGKLITTNVNQNLGGTNGASFFNFNGGTLKATGFQPAFMTGLTRATVQSAGAVIDDSGFIITIGQALLDGGTGGGLTKLGSGTVKLTGPSTYNGPTAVNAGRLAVPATQTGTGAVTVADSADLRVTAANTIQLSPVSITLGSSAGATIEFNAVSNTTVAPVSVGTYTLNGIDPLKVVGGVFVNSNSYPLIHYVTKAGSGTNIFTPPGGMTATLSTSNNTIYLNVLNIGVQLWKGNVNTNWDIETTTNWTVNATPSVYGDGGLVQFDDTAVATSVNIVSEVLPSGVIISNAAKTYTFSGAGAISGVGSLTMSGSGLAVMGNTNTYSGPTTINSGTFRLAGNNVIPSGSGNGSVLVNGTLDLAGHSNTINGLSGSGIVDSTVAGAAALTVGLDGSSSIFSGVVQNTAATLALVKVGIGAFTLVGNNSHSGGTTLSAGQLNIDSATALGAAAGTFTINGGTIDNTTSNTITVANNNPQAWNGPFTYAGSVTNLNLGTGAVAIPASTNRGVTVTANNLIVGGLISGGGSGITKLGGGTLSLLGMNTFSASMFINAGTVVVSNVGDAFSPGGVGAGGIINFGAGGVDGRLTDVGPGETTFKVISLADNSGGGAIINMSGTGLLDFGSDLQVGGTSAHNLTLEGSGPGTGEVDGAISDYGPGNPTSVIKGGTGVWMLIMGNMGGAVNTYTGDTSIKTGTLVVASIGNAGAAPNDLGGGTNIILGSVGATGTVVYVGGGETTSKNIGLTASGTGGGIIDQSGSGLLEFTGILYGTQPFAKSITLQGSATGSGEFAGAITENGTNQCSVIKSGTGLWTLSAATNTYTGATTVNSGTLAIAGSGTISNSPTITVASGATLDLSGHTGGGMTFVVGQTLAGSGTVIGAVTIANGATLSPGGASPGTLTIQGNLVLNNSSALAYQLGTNSDRTVVEANLTLAGALTVTNSGGFGPGNYTLITYSGTLVNNGLTVNPLPGGLTGTIVAGGGTVVLQVAASSDPYTAWAGHYGLSGANANGNANPTGDGMDNTNKFLAGFNPTNNAAYLHVISIAKTNTTDINVIYLGASGDTSYAGGPSSRTNVLEFTTGTANGSYSSNNFTSTGVSNILSGGIGLGTLTNMVDSGGATNVPSRYYRVRVLVP
jgi:autotransporter-associated beta strand protein